MGTTVGTGTSSIRPYKISIPDTQLSALQHKLALTSFPDEVDCSETGIGQQWSMGAPLDDIKRLTNHWKTSFDWRQAERELNETLPQFVASVPVTGFGELDVHFVYQRAETRARRTAIPLLFIHGWPGSFIEVKKLLPLLTQVNEDEDDLPVFDVVAPSLPNFGFSDGASKKGFGLAQYAESLNAVMAALGYSEYVIQGGDWGSFIARAMATFYPNHVKAVHLNFLPVPPPYPWKHPVLFLQSLLTLPFSAAERAKIGVLRAYLDDESGYSKQQDTRPQTLGYALHDSPVGLLAWVYEKLHAWTDAYAWTDDEVLTWVSIYVFSRAGPAASLRIYYESTHPDRSNALVISRDQTVVDALPHAVKIAVANFPKEIIQSPSSWVRGAGNVVRETSFDRGGHFAAWEVPEVLARDVKAFLSRTGEAYGAVSEKHGY